MNVGDDEARWQPLPGIENEDTESAMRVPGPNGNPPKMNAASLKPRAKRLRKAVAEMFNVTISHSQALELVAKEENYPNWDAACASFELPASCGSHIAVQCNLQVKVVRDQAPSMASIFAGADATATELNRLMDKTDERGALILIAGPVMHGKSVTAGVLMREYGMGRLAYRHLLMDEIRDEQDALEAVRCALTGVKVVSTIHATKGLDRLRLLLSRHGAGESLLDRLIADGRVILLQQELEWADAEWKQELEQARRVEWDTAVRAAVSSDPEFVFQLVKN